MFVDLVPEPQKVVDGKAEAGVEDDYKTDEFTKLATRDETNNLKLKRFKRDRESIGEKSGLPPKPLSADSKAEPATAAEASGALSDLQFSFQKRFYVLGISWGILYGINRCRYL